MADEPKKGDASPLEGTLGPQIMFALNCAFTSMTLGMCQNLTLTAGQALEAPLLKQDLANISGPVAAASRNLISGGPSLTTPGLTGPAFPTPKMGGLFG